MQVGTAGWSYADWEGIVYPPGAPRGFDRLAFLSGLFDVLEINTSFYRLPEPRQVETWQRRTRGRPEFRFTVKAWRALTHEEPEGGGAGLEEAARAFAEAVRPLERSGRLGAVLLQFPYRFRPGEAAWERLARLAALLRDLRVAAEFRRETWADPAALERLRALGMAFCNIDQPRLPGNLAPTAIVTAPFAYVRLHGRNAGDWFREGAGRDARYDYLYSEEEIEEWAERVRALAGAGAEEIFVIANNHYRGKAACNALELKRRLEDPRAQPPPALAAAFPRLGPARSERQRSLF